MTTSEENEVFETALADMMARWFPPGCGVPEHEIDAARTRARLVFASMRGEASLTGRSIAEVAQEQAAEHAEQLTPEQREHFQRHRLNSEA